MNIGKPFVDAWTIYVKNFWTILISLIVVIILSIVSLGVLVVPLFTGFQMLFVKAMRKKKIVVNEVLDPIGRFFSLTFANISIAIMVIFGCFLLLVPGLAWAVAGFRQAVETPALLRVPHAEEYGFMVPAGGPDGVGSRMFIAVDAAGTGHFHKLVSADQFPVLSIPFG